MHLKKSEGFTLVELMITLLLVGVVTGAIYSSYITMQRSYIAQDQIAEMQQNLRAAMDIMVRDIRMAGYDPTKSASAGIVTASKGSLQFTRDTTNDATGTADDGDGDLLDLNENTTFGFSLANDANGDGIADAGVAPFGRRAFAAGFQDLAENIVAVEFNYILKNNTNTLAPLAGQLNDIRSIQISMLARADRADPEYRDARQYVTGSGAIWGGAAGFNDNFRRRLMITTVQCRNMGL